MYLTLGSAQSSESTPRDVPRPVGHTRALKYRMVNIVMQLVVGNDLVDLARRVPDYEIGVHTRRDRPFAVLQAVQLGRQSTAYLYEALGRD